MVDVAAAAGCDAVHPGYGFLTENAGFARRCADAGLTFVGPSPERPRPPRRQGAGPAGRRCRRACRSWPARTRRSRSRRRRRSCDASPRGVAVMLKAVAGGGGRGMRVVTRPGSRQALRAVPVGGDGRVRRRRLYVEQYLPLARHVEVQILGDGTGAVSAHLGERDCSIQRRHQKVVEIAPAPGLPGAAGGSPTPPSTSAGVAPLRQRRHRRVPRGRRRPRSAFSIEANPRLQVEHTVTEEVTGVDLVAAQLRLAGGAPLAALGLDPPRRRRRHTRLGHPAAGEHRDDPARRHDRARPAAPCPSTRCRRPRRAGSTVRLRRLPDHAHLRLAAGEADRAPRAGRSPTPPPKPTGRCRSAASRGSRRTWRSCTSVLRAPAFAAGGVTTSFVDELYAGEAARDRSAPSLPRRHFDGGGRGRRRRRPSGGGGGAPGAAWSRRRADAGTVVSVSSAAGDLVRARAAPRRRWSP